MTPSPAPTSCTLPATPSSRTTAPAPPGCASPTPGPRIPHTHRYQVTTTGLRHAMFLTRTHDRILRTGLAELNGPDPAPLRKASSIYQAAIDDLTQRAGIAA